MTPAQQQATQSQDQTFTAFATIVGILLLIWIAKLIFKAVMFARKIRMQNDIHAMRDRMDSQSEGNEDGLLTESEVIDAVDKQQKENYLPRNDNPPF